MMGEYLEPTKKTTVVESNYDVYEAAVKGIDGIIDEVESLGPEEAVEIINGEIVLEGRNARNMEKKGPKLQFLTSETERGNLIEEARSPRYRIQEKFEEIDPEDRYVRLSWVSPRKNITKYTTIEDCIDGFYLTAGWKGDVKISGRCKGREAEGTVPSRSREFSHHVALYDLPVYPEDDYEKMVKDAEYEGETPYYEILEGSIFDRRKPEDFADWAEIHEILEDRIFDIWKPEYFADWAETGGYCTGEDWFYSGIAKDVHSITKEKLVNYPQKFCAHKISAFLSLFPNYQNLNPRNKPIMTNLFIIPGPELRLFNVKLRNQMILNKQKGRNPPTKAERNVLEMSFLGKSVQDGYNIRTSKHALKEELGEVRELLQKN